MRPVRSMCIRYAIDLVFFLGLFGDEWDQIQKQHGKHDIYSKCAGIENKSAIPSWYLAEHIFVDARNYDNGWQTPLNIHLNVDSVEKVLENLKLEFELIIHLFVTRWRCEKKNPPNGNVKNCVLSDVTTKFQQIINKQHINGFTFSIAASKKSYRTSVQIHEPMNKWELFRV